jgi:hypothetical protein
MAGMRFGLLFAFTVLSMFAGRAWADCEDFRDPPGGQYEPGDFQGIEYEPWELECCCFNNVITLVSYTDELVREGYCCNNQNVNCNNYKYRRESAATPVEYSGLINKIGPDGKALEVPLSAISRIQEGEICICAGGASSLCGPANGSGGILYTLDCEECPE